MTEVVAFITELGFPISITLYLLLRFEKRLTDLCEAIHDLNIEMTKYIKR